MTIEPDHNGLKSQRLDDLIQDLRYAVRGLAHSKAFAAAAISTLALGIGANTAIFSVVNGVVLRPLPFAQPDRLVQVSGTTPLSPQGAAVGAADLEAFRTQSTSFETLAGYYVSARYLRGPSGADRVMTVTAERSFFSVLGVAPIAGRTFQPDDAATVAVVSEAFWKQRLAGDPSIVGRSITLDDERFTIIGVMPGSFQFPYGAASLLSGVLSETPTELWLPTTPPAPAAPAARARGRIGSVTGRLKGNVSVRTAASELALIARRLEQQFPDTNRGIGVRVVPLSEGVVAASVRRPLFMLLIAVGIVLALACANVTNLSLVRMTLRTREIAVRAALGANPLRLLRQLMTESLVLAVAGGSAGLALAWWGTGRMTSLVSARIPRATEAGLDWRVFLFLLVTCAGAAVIFGLAPAIIGMRTDAQSVLKESGGHATMGIGPRRLRDALVVAEIALAFVLAIGATLLIREIVRLRHTDPGMSVSNVLTVHLGQRMTPRTDPRQWYEIADRVAQLPGVRAAGFTQMLPLQNWGWSSNSSVFTVRGRPPQTLQFPIELRYVTPGYFQALGIPLRRGRAFTERDVRDAPPVILINETLARRYFGDDDPVGQSTTRGTIAGVVGDVRQVNLDQPARPEIYYPIAQNWSQVSELGMSLVVGTRDRPEGMIDAVRSVIREVVPHHAVFTIKTMERVAADSLSDFTLYLSLMSSFAALALLLAVTGTYSVISYIAASRTREFAIRVALGASKTRVTRLVLGQGIRLTAIGLGCGLFGALAAAPLLQNLPVSVRPPDVLTIAPVAAFLGMVSIAGCLIPALRAATVSPTSMLRSE